nr:sigma-70, region 4 [uncultured bacterium]AMP54400.1 sigma-70, region 4 [uncultured bacterium]
MKFNNITRIITRYTPKTITKLNFLNSLTNFRELINNCVIGANPRFGASDKATYNLYIAKEVLDSSTKLVRDAIYTARAQGMSIEEIAVELGMSVTEVSRYEDKEVWENYRTTGEAIPGLGKDDVASPTDLVRSVEKEYNVKLPEQRVYPEAGDEVYTEDSNGVTGYITDIQGFKATVAWNPSGDPKEGDFVTAKGYSGTLVSVWEDEDSVVKATIKYDTNCTATVAYSDVKFVTGLVRMDSEVTEVDYASLYLVKTSKFSN